MPVMSIGTCHQKRMICDSTGLTCAYHPRVVRVLPCQTECREWWISNASRAPVPLNPTLVTQKKMTDEEGTVASPSALRIYVEGVDGFTEPFPLKYDDLEDSGRGV